MVVSAKKEKTNGNMHKRNSLRASRVVVDWVAVKLNSHSAADEKSKGGESLGSKDHGRKSKKRCERSEAFGAGWLLFVSLFTAWVA